VDNQEQYLTKKEKYEYQEKEEEGRHRYFGDSDESFKSLLLIKVCSN